MHMKALLCLLMLPLLALAAAPAQTEYQLAIHATPDVAHGESLFTQCASCHGASGAGLPDGSTPRIAGQHFHVLVKQLVDFRYGKRWDFRMQQRANSHLGAFQDIADVASYLSQQPRGSHAGAVDPESRMLGANLYKADCASCHGAQGEGDDAGRVPMLAGQHPAYLLRQIYDAVDERRPALARLHSPAIKPLDFEQLRAVSEFLSQLGSGQ
jgi:cytochrome c553